MKQSILLSLLQKKLLSAEGSLTYPFKREWKGLRNEELSCHSFNCYAATCTRGVSHNFDSRTNNNYKHNFEKVTQTSSPERGAISVITNALYTPPTQQGMATDFLGFSNKAGIPLKILTL